jgi:hypothetical protein
MPRVRIAIIAATSLAVTAFGVVRLVAPSDASSGTTDQASVDSLTAQVTKAGWASMDHDMDSDAPGYTMPPAMMPGMPEGGDERLEITVTVVNTSDDTRPLRPDKEFTLHAGKTGRKVAPHSDTFGDLPRLAPHNAVSGILYFDLQPNDLTDAPAWVEWTHGDAANQLTIPMEGVDNGPSHSH